MHTTPRPSGSSLLIHSAALGSARNRMYPCTRGSDVSAFASSLGSVPYLRAHNQSHTHTHKQRHTRTHTYAQEHIRGIHSHKITLTRTCALAGAFTHINIDAVLKTHPPKRETSLLIAQTVTFGLTYNLWISNNNQSTAWRLPSEVGVRQDEYEIIVSWDFRHSPREPEQ